MKLLWKLSKEAVRYRTLYVVAILATLSLTCVNLAAPRVLAAITGLISKGIDAEALSKIGTLTFILALLYLSRIAFRFMSSYFSHKAAWYLDHVRAMLKALKVSAIFHPTVEFISSLGTILVAGLGGYLAYHGGLDVEDIVAFFLYLSLFYTPVSGLATLLENMQQSLAGAERVITILDAPVEIKDKPDAQPLKNVQGEIAFENVSFSYQEGKPVLQDVSFRCQPGQMLALVGQTGVGKTTLAQLISRFYEPDAGRILIDGRNISDVTIESLRRSISPVLQDTFLFNGTIAENIGYARPDAALEEIRAAAAAANIDADICAMPDGYETVVGERGVRLSGGQKQRVAIARAILRNSPVIILDEATAAVDVETEKQIRDAISSLTGKRTIIAIAHRLSTIRSADQILVIQNGRVAERGTHEQLLALGGIYARMHKVQQEDVISTGQLRYNA